MELYSVGQLFDSAPDGVLLCRNGIISYLNTACSRLLSACGSHLKPGDPLPAELADLPQGRQLVLLEGGLLSAERWPFPAGGEETCLYTLRGPMPEGEVTQRLELIARHLRAPLSASFSALDRMEAQPLEDHLRRLAGLRRSCYRVMHTVNELQLLSDLYSERSEVAMTGLDLTGLLRELFWELKGFLMDIPFTLELEQTGDLMIRGNSPLLRQLLLGLISNAIGSGGDQLTVSAKKQGKQGVLTLRDNGRGITARQLAYTRYPLLSESEVQPQLSAGLPICYRIAQVHGGSLLIRSDEGGTRCTLTFPLISNSELPGELPLNSPPFGMGCEDLFAALSEVVPDRLYRLENVD